MTLLAAMLAALSFAVLSPVTHSRTCSGMMSIIRIGPNSGMMCRYSE